MIFVLGLDAQYDPNSEASSGNLKNKPNALSLYAYTQSDNASGVKLPPVDGALLGTILCQVTAKTPQQAFDKFGVECENPYFVVCEIADVTNVKVGQKATLTIEGIEFVFRVRTKEQIHGALSKTNHATFLLEQVERA